MHIRKQITPRGRLENFEAFECIVISGKDFQSITSKRSYDIINNENPFKPWSTQEFAHKCAALINVLTAFFKDLKNGESNVIVDQIDQKNKKEVAEPTETISLSPYDAFVLIFKNKDSCDLAIKMLYDFGIINSQTNKWDLKGKEYGRLYAVIDALNSRNDIFIQTPGVIEAKSVAQLLKHFNKFLEVSCIEFSRRSKAYKNTIGPAKAYIEKDFKI